MEQEDFLSGYCRAADSSRIVTVVTDSGKLLETDCCFGSCVYEPNCQIAAKIRDILKRDLP